MSAEEARTPVGYAKNRPQAPGGVQAADVVAVIADEGQIFLLNTNAAVRELALPPAADVPIGWSVRVQRRDAAAVNALEIATTDGATLNGAATPFTSSVAQAVFTVTKVAAADWMVG